MAIQSLSREEILRILAAARARSERDWLMILVCYRHGLRASEVCGLKRDNLRDGFLTLQRLKGSKRTSQELLGDENPLLNERKALLDYALNRARNQNFFGIKKRRFQQLFEEHAKTAGIPAHKRHVHVLKHAIAKHLIDKAGIQNTRQWLGHKSMASTGKYLEVSDEDATAAVRRVFEGKGE